MATAVRGSSTGIDVARARQQTPGCERTLHFNNAGAALMPVPVIEALQRHHELEAEVGGYEAAEMAADRVRNTYVATARMLDAAPEEIALFDGATRAWDAIFYSLPLGPGDRILTSRAEYASNYLPMLQRSRQAGAVIVVIDDDDTGQIDVGRLEAAIDGRTRLIALTHVPSTGGLVNPAVAVGAVARAAGVPYMLDCCQSAGQLPLSVEEIGCDFLTTAGRKYLRGPRGTGILYVNRSWIDRLEPLMLDMHSASLVAGGDFLLRDDAGRFEQFEHSVAARIGLGVAIDYALEWGLEAIDERVTALALQLRQELTSLPGVTVCDRGRRLCGIVTFTVDGMNAGDVRQRLREGGINTWVCSAGSSPLRPDGEATEMVRASVHYYNTENEVDRFVAAVSAL